LGFRDYDNTANRLMTKSQTHELNPNRPKLVGMFEHGAELKALHPSFVNNRIFE